MRRVVMIAAAVLLAGCKGSTDVQPGDRFTIRVGDRVEIGGGGAVRLVAVPQDSRCPTDVVCIWAGDAVARLDLIASGDSARADLHTNTQAGSSRTQVGGFTLELVGLTPEPRSGGQIPQTDYVATLAVSSP